MEKLLQVEGRGQQSGWKIFEVTGTKAGQDLALDLLSFVGKMVTVGFGLSKSEYMFSKLMAFDAEIIGTWGSLPEYYPIVLDMVLKKYHVIDLSLKKARDLLSDAKAELAIFNDSPVKDSLFAVADYTLARGK